MTPLDTETALLSQIEHARARIALLEASLGPLKRQLWAATTYASIATADDFARGHAAAEVARAALSR